jgi:hypothetical protein
VPTHEHSNRRWPFRLIMAIGGCLFSAIFVATQIPAVRETVGIAKTIYGFINSTVPSLGVAAIWIGFVLIGGGVIAAWQFHRTLQDGTIKMMAVGSAVLAVALGGLVAAISTLNQPSAATSNYTASTGIHHRSTRRRHRHHPTPAKHSSSGGSKATTAPSPAPTNSTPAPASQNPTPAPAPSPPPSGGGSSASGGSGSNGNDNKVTVTKSNEQTATTGNAEGTDATSGPATNTNNEAPTNISIG